MFTAIHRISNAFEGEALLANHRTMFGEARSKGKKPRPLVWIDLNGAVEHSGKLEMKGSEIRSWFSALVGFPQRFFEFDCASQRLCYFDADDADIAKQAGEVKVVGCVDIPAAVEFNSEWKYVFAIRVAEAGGGIALLDVAAETAEEKEQWMRVLSNTPAQWQEFMADLCERRQGKAYQRPLVLLSSDWNNRLLMEALEEDGSSGFEAHNISKGSDDTPEPPEYRAGDLHEEFKLRVEGAAIEAPDLLELLVPPRWSRRCRGL